MTVGLPDFPATRHDDRLPQRFEFPPTRPAPGGLLAAVSWQPVDGVARFFDGVAVSGPNRPAEDAVGAWDQPWCGVPALDGPRKAGIRRPPRAPFAAVTTWAADECDATAPSRAEVVLRAEQALILRESGIVARAFAARLLTDAAGLPGGVPTMPDVTEAVSTVEAGCADARGLGVVHAAPSWLSRMVAAHLITRTSAGWVTPAGHSVIFDAGYRAGLGDALVATTAPLVGWRNDVVTRTALAERTNRFVAVSERSCLVAYEDVIAAVEVDP